jgi:hypothetical protein
VLTLDIKSLFEHDVRELLVVCESVAGMSAGVGVLVGAGVLVGTGVGVLVGAECSGVVEGAGVEVEVAPSFIRVTGGEVIGVVVKVDAGADVDMGVHVVSCSGIDDREEVDIGTLLAELLSDEGGEEKRVVMSSVLPDILRTDTSWAAGAVACLSMSAWISCKASYSSEENEGWWFWGEVGVAVRGGEGVTVGVVVNARGGLARKDAAMDTTGADTERIESLLGSSDAA